MKTAKTIEQSVEAFYKAFGKERGATAYLSALPQMKVNNTGFLTLTANFNELIHEQRSLDEKTAYCEAQAKRNIEIENFKQEILKTINL